MPRRRSYKKASTMQMIMLFIAIAMIPIICFVGYRLFANNEDIYDDDATLEQVRQEVILPDYNIHTNAIMSDANMLRHIDFDELYSKSENVFGWVYIPDTHIDHYVMQEQEVGETYYLWRDIAGKKNSVGSILTPAEPDLGIDDAHLLLFGHRLINKNQGFSDLKKFRDKDYAIQHKYAYLYYKDHVERWVLWTVNYEGIRYDDMVYEIPFQRGTNQYQDLLNHVESTATHVLLDESASKDDRTLMLSTCYGNNANGATDYRLYASYQLSATYYYDTDEFVEYIE